MQIFEKIKSRGVEDVLFISMDGVSGLEEGAKSIYKIGDLYRPPIKRSKKITHLT